MNYKLKITLWVLILILKTQSITAQDFNENYSTNGVNYKVIEKENKLYIGGQFTEVGKYVNGFGEIDPITGEFNILNKLKIDGNVSDIIEDGKNGFYLLGTFNYINDTPVYNLAHIYSNGTLDTSFNFYGKIRTHNSTYTQLIRYGDTLIVLSGHINTNQIGAINLKTNKIIDWNPIINGKIQTIYANEKFLFLGGELTSFNGNKISNFVQLNKNDFSYVHTPGFNKPIKEFIIDSGKIVSKGNFDFNGWLNVGLNYLDTQNFNQLIAQFRLEGSISKMIEDPKGGWFLCGNFTIKNRPKIKNLLRINANYTLDTIFLYNFSNNLRDIIIIDSFIVCLSSFNTVVNSVSFNSIVLLNHINNKVSNHIFDSDGFSISLLNKFNNELIVARSTSQSINLLERYEIPTFKKLKIPHSNVFDAKIDSNYLYFVNQNGTFDYGNDNISLLNNKGEYKDRIAEKYLTTCNASISDGNGGWYIAGSSIMHIYADGSIEKNFIYSSQGGGFNSILKYGDTLFVGGTFRSISKGNTVTNINNFAFINLKSGNIGSLDLEINNLSPNYLDGNINKILLVEDTLYLGGKINIKGNFFTNTPYYNLMKLNVKNFGLSNQIHNFNNQIYSIEQKDSFIYLGGFFNKVNGEKRNGLCRINLKNNKLDKWNPQLDTLSEIRSINTTDSLLLISNKIVDPFNYNTKLLFQRINLTNGTIRLFNNLLDSNLATSSSHYIKTILVHEDTVYLCGTFINTLNSQNINNILRVNKNTGLIYPIKTTFLGLVSDVIRKPNGDLMLFGTLNAINEQKNILMSRYNLQNNYLDTWKINAPNTTYSNATFDFINNDLFLALPGINDITIDNITRRFLFKFNKSNGKPLNFNGKINMSTNSNYMKLSCSKSNIYFTIENRLYIFKNGKDSILHTSIFQQPFSGKTGTHVLVNSKNSPYIVDDFKLYTREKLNLSESYNPETRDFENGLNNYPGTFTNFNKHSIIFGSYKDSIFYLGNDLGSFSQLYKVIPKLKIVKLLDYKIKNENNLFRTDNGLYFYGSNNVLEKFDEELNVIDKNFNAKPNGMITKLYQYKKMLYFTGHVSLINKQNRKDFCVIDLTADTIMSFNPFNESVSSTTVEAIAIKDSTLFIGNSTGLKSYNTNTFNLVRDYNTVNNFNNLSIHKNKLYFSGNFTTSNGISNIARIDLITHSLDNWNPKLTMFNQPLKYLFDDSFIYITGAFNKVNNIDQPYFAKLRLDNAANQPLTFKLRAPNNKFVNEGSGLHIRKIGNLIYLSGNFELDNKRKYLIALNYYTLTPTNFHLDFDPNNSTSIIGDLIQYEDKLMAITSLNTEINKVFSKGNITFLDRYDKITYPSKKNLQGVNLKFENWDNPNYYIYNGILGITINKNRVGNLLKIISKTEINQESVSSFFPNFSSNIGSSTLTIKGNLLSQKCEIFIVKNKDTIFSNFQDIYDNSILKVKFNFNNDSIGKYDLFIKLNSGKILKFDSAYILQEKITSKIKTTIIGFDIIRPNRPYYYVLRVANKSNVNLKNVPLFLSTSQNTILKIESENLFIDTFVFHNLDSLNGLKIKNRLYSILVPEIEASSIFKIPFIIDKTTGDSVILNSWHFLPIDNIQKTKCLSQMLSKIRDTNINLNCVTDALNTFDDSSKSYTNNLDFGKPSSIFDFNKLFKQSNINCGASNTQQYDLRLTTFVSNTFYQKKIDSTCFDFSDDNSDSAIFKPSFENKFNIKVINSIDPNDKIGLKGKGKGNSFKELPKSFPYVIRFENDSSASAPTQTIIIRDTIDKNVFDINSITFTSFKIGSYIYYFPEGTNNINKFFDFKNKANCILNLKTNIDTTSGVITWTFKALDIETLEFEKLNPLYGFLHPNDKTNRGQGLVSFEIDFINNHDANIDIKNRADIFFDENKSILTPYWVIKKDNLAPNSRVLNIPLNSHNNNIPIYWEAKDSSEIKEIEVFISRNNIVYTLWQKSISDSSSIFNGKKDSTYYFFTIATDIVGNKETKSNIYDTKTTIKLLTNVNQLKSEKKYLIFPNPSNGVINIKINSEEEWTYKIYDINGINLVNEKVSLGETKFYIKNKGIYIIEIFSNNNLIGYEKIIIN